MSVVALGALLIALPQEPPPVGAGIERVTGSAPATNPVLPGGTEIPVTTIEELSSRTARQGQRFKLEVSADIVLGRHVVIPKGTPAIGEVRRVQGKGMAGKRGVLEVQLLFLELAGQRIRIDGRARDDGTPGTVPVIGSVVLVGALGGFVTGTSATLSKGTSLTGHLYKDLPLRTVD